MKNGKDKSDVVALVDDILAHAVACGASDVHFEPTSRGLIIKYRLDGVLSTVEELPRLITENVIARLKVLGGLLTYRNDIPQEGRIAGEQQQQAGGVADKRLAVFPTIHGQRAVVRIFYETSSFTDLSQLGFSDYILTSLQHIAAQNQGVLLITGPAGSGKSTTLAALLRHILKTFPGKSVVSLEDPVERNIEGVTQVQIPPSGDMTFPVALRSLLRQDPEVLMIGEIRDAETARIAVQAGLTGHLLMSTMHSGSPAGALLRLLEMGIEPYQVTSSVAAVVNQRLVRRLCNACKVRLDPAGGFAATGCPACMKTGFSGRAMIAEMVRLDGQLRRAVIERMDLDELEAILKSRGHMTMAQDGARLIAAGITTKDEVERACGARMTRPRKHLTQRT